MSSIGFNSFNFYQLDGKLNKKRLQRIKKQQEQKQKLDIFEKFEPNKQFGAACDKIMKQYVDHYNGNRRFRIIQDKDRQDIQQNKEENPTYQKIAQINSKPSTQFTSLDSSQDNTIKRNPSKSLISSAQNIMKPLKLNTHLKGSKQIHQYINKNPFISQNIDDTFKNLNFKNQFGSTDFQILSFSKINSLTKQSYLYKKSKQKSISMKNPSNLTRQRRKYLRKIFRKNIFLIIQKLKIMKLSFSEIIQKKILDSKVPYRHGQSIFNAIKEGDEPKVFRLIMQNRISIFGRDTTNKTTLMWACIRGYQKIADLLLSNGIDPHFNDINGKTALNFSVKYNNIQCAKTICLYSYYVEDSIDSMEMSNQMRKIIRVGFQTQKFLKNLKNTEKKKQYFQQQFRYFYKQ